MTAVEWTNVKSCSYCGMYHPGIACPRVKAIEYHANGTVKRVEFHEAGPTSVQGEKS